MIDSKADIKVLKAEDLRDVLGIEIPIVMYVGNLESYQGIDLLLEGFSYLIHESACRASLVIIGGDTRGIDKYSVMASKLNISHLVYLIGPRPLETLSSYLLQADILVSPRLKGVNTPMKLFSYLKSGKPVLATNLLTHTQVVDDLTAFLVNPNPKALAGGLMSLLTNRELRDRLGMAGKHLVETCYSHDAFIQEFNSAMSWLESELQRSRGQK